MGRKSQKRKANEGAVKRASGAAGEGGRKKVKRGDDSAQKGDGGSPKENKNRSLQPLDVLPLVAWDIILGQITDMQDVKSLLQTPLKNLEGWGSKWLRLNAISEALNYLPKKDVLNCREVSKGWRQVVDTSLGFTAANGRLLINHWSTHHLLPKEISLNFRSSCTSTVSQKIEKFLKVFKKNQLGSPLVSRAVTLELKTLCPMVLQFFDEFGGYVWTLRLRGSATNSTLLDRVRYIFRILNKVPNVHALELQYSDSKEILSGDDFNEIREYLQLAILPPLPHLKNLTVLGGISHIFHGKIYDKYSQQLVRIGPSVNWSMNNQGFAKLTALSVDLDLETGGFAGHWIEALRKLKNVQDLQVSLCVMDVEDHVLMSDLMMACQHLPLKHVTIVGGAIPLKNLRLPTLVRIELLNADTEKSQNLRYLRNFPKLESLIISFKSECYRDFTGTSFVEQDYVVDGLEDGRSMDLARVLEGISSCMTTEDNMKLKNDIYNSSVWTEVPSLNVIRHRLNDKHIYFRKEQEIFQSMAKSRKCGRSKARKTI